MVLVRGSLGQCCDLGLSDNLRVVQLPKKKYKSKVTCKGTVVYFR